MTVSKWSIRKWEERRWRETDIHLSISVVILSSPFISLCFLFLRLSPHPSLTLSPPCSFLMLSLLTPQGSLSFPAFSCCFIYSLFNSLRCICSSFLLALPLFPCLIHHLSLSHSLISPPLLVHFTHQPSAVSPLLVSNAFSAGENLRSIYITWRALSFSLQFMFLALCHASYSICFIIYVPPLSFSVSLISPLHFLDFLCFFVVVLNCLFFFCPP